MRFLKMQSKGKLRHVVLSPASAEKVFSELPVVFQVDILRGLKAFKSDKIRMYYNENRQ